MARNACLILCLFLPLAGCGVVNPQRSGPTANNRQGPSKQLAMGPTINRDAVLADPSTMIPPPPNMNFPDIPGAPAKDDSLAFAPANTQLIAMAGTGRPQTELVRAVAEEAVNESNFDSLRRLHRTASASYAKLQGFEAKLTRRETVGTKAMPEEVLQFKFRKEPYSMHVKWIGLEAQGREMVYVQGKYDNKVQILTGKGEGLLIRAGQRWAFPPLDSQVRSKSRFDIREGGMGMSIDWFGRVLSIVEQDPSQANRLKAVGPKPRLERAAGLEAVEETIPSDWEPLLPKGGRRTTYFDIDPRSPSHGLPILVITLNETGRQVEYYWFDEFKLLQPTDDDFDIERLWKK